MKLPNNFYYFSYFIVLPKRFERLTHNLEGCCSIQLSYGSIFLIKELSQHKYNKNFWNFQIIFIIFCIFCAYSWIRTNALPYPYGRFLCLSGLTDSISNISRHYFESSIVSCSVYASNLYRQIIVGPEGLELSIFRLWVCRIRHYTMNPIIKELSNFHNTNITKLSETSK